MDLQTLNDMPPWDWPEGTRDIILKVLCDRDASFSDRILAAEMAGNIVVLDDDMAEALLDVTRNSSEAEELRCRTAVALGPGLDYGSMSDFDENDDLMLSEKKFQEVRGHLRNIYQDTATPKHVRRKILETSVRASAKWQEKAIREAYSSNDRDWKITAIFCMGYVSGFDDQVIESLESEDPDILYEAVCAAGNREIKAAWPYVKELFTKDDIDKPLLLAAIDAASLINPFEAIDILGGISASDDEEIADAVEEALTNAEMMAFDDSGDGEEDDLL